MTKKKTCFGLIVGTRGFFNADLAKDGKKRLISTLDGLGYDYLILPESATPTGCVETTEDGRKCAAFFKENAEKIDGIVVTLPNFGDELGIVNAVHEANIGVPVLLQAEDDDVDKVDVKHRRDAFCGKLSVSNNFYQYQIPFTDTTYHSCKVDSEEFKADLVRFAAICRVVNGLEKGPNRGHWGSARRLPDHAGQREAAPALRHHHGNRGPLGDPLQGHGYERRRPPGRKEAGGDSSVRKYR